MKTFKEWIYDKGGIYGEPMPASGRQHQAPIDPNDHVGTSIVKNPDGTMTVTQKFASGQEKKSIVKSQEELKALLGL